MFGARAAIALKPIRLHWDRKGQSRNGSDREQPEEMDLTSSSEADLTRRCRNGEPRAWRELIRRFTPLVYRVSLRMLDRKSVV